MWQALGLKLSGNPVMLLPVVEFVFPSVPDSRSDGDTLELHQKLKIRELT